MPKRIDATTREQFLTAGWNNVLVLGLGVPALAVAALALFTSALSDRVGFFGLVAIGVVY